MSAKHVHIRILLLTLYIAANHINICNIIEIGNITIYGSKLKPMNISKDTGKFIDELPILFVIAALTKGISKFSNIGDLKNKESDRLIESKKIRAKKIE